MCSLLFSRPTFKAMHYRASLLFSILKIYSQRLFIIFALSIFYGYLICTLALRWIIVGGQCIIFPLTVAVRIMATPERNQWREAHLDLLRDAVSQSRTRIYGPGLATNSSLFAIPTWPTLLPLLSKF